MSTRNQVILVDVFDNEIGTMEKLEAHRTPNLHRAFSVFLADNNKMLIQKRALHKYHSPGLWANACCSHPQPNETTLDSAKLRLHQEIGVECNTHELFTFTYLNKFNDNLFEYELDHVLLGEYSGEVFENPDEVSEVKWIDVDELAKNLIENPLIYCSWFLICAPKVIEIIKIKNKSGSAY